MIKLSKHTSILTFKQSQNLKFIKCCSQKAGSELKPRFDFKIAEDIEDNFLNDKFKAKNHPGIFSRHCKNIKLPSHIEKAIQTVQEENGYTSAHLNEEAKSLSNYIWSRQAPFEQDDLRDTLEMIAAKYIKRGIMPADFFDGGSDPRSVEDLSDETRSILTKGLKKHVYDWKPLEFNEFKSFVYLWGRAAPDYAALVKIFKEIQIRKTEFQPRAIFDFGSGVGTVTWAVDTVWPKTCREIYNVDASSSMNKLAERLLKGSAENSNDKNPLTPNIYYRQFLPTSETLRYDIVVSSRSLFEVGNLRERARTVDILWRKVKPGGFMVLVEAGTQFGYRVLLEARDYLLKISEIYREKYSIESPIHVFSPCPHDESCPRFSHVSQTPCYFGVSYTYPKYINIRSSHKNRNDLFSYVVLQKASREDSYKWPRVVEPLIKRSGHTIIRTCTPNGSIREFVTTKFKQGNICYKLCKKCKWGDLLPIHFKNEEAAQFPEMDSSETQSVISSVENASDVLDPSFTDGKES